MKLRMPCLGMLILATACQGVRQRIDDEPSESGSNWQDQLELLSRTPGAVMAPQYLRAPEDGTMLRIALHSTEQACKRHSSTKEGSGDFWWVSAYVGAPDEGEYTIGAKIDESLPRVQRRSATVRLSEVRDWKRQRVYDAAEGTVTIYNVPKNFDTWGGEVEPAIGRIEAMFSLTPRHQLECMGEVSESSQATRSCQCIDDQETITTCVPEGNENCCIGPPPYRSWSVEFEASPCPDLCAATSAQLYAQYCKGFGTQ